VARGDDHVDARPRAGRPAARRAASFRRGLRNRHPLVLVAAVVLAAAFLVGVETLLRAGAFTAVPEGRFVRYRNDDNAHVTYLMARLREAPPGGATVYLLGGSATMESFLSERSLAADVNRAAGGEVGLVSLAAHSQSLAESLALVENLPEGPGLLAVGLAPMRFTNGPGDDAGLLFGEPFFLRSSRVRALLQEEPAGLVPVDTLVPGAIRYVVGYVRERRHDGLALLADVGYSEHYTLNGPLHSASQKLEMASRDVAEDGARYAQYADYNFSVLEALVVLARERGFAVVFFDQPLNGHVLGAEWEGVVPSYRQRAAALAARLGVPYLDVAQRVTLEDRDFLDVYHLVIRGRLKWQPVFARQLGAALRSTGLATTAPASGGALSTQAEAAASSWGVPE
jgi:hypothetical protein